MNRARPTSYSKRGVNSLHCRRLSATTMPQLRMFCAWLQLTGCAFAFRAPSLLLFHRGAIRTYTKMLGTTAEKADAWAEGINAAPAIMCDVENVPLLDPVPAG